MKVELARSIEDVKKVLTHPEIYPTISGDGAPPSDEYEPPQAIYLCGYVDDEPIALFVLHPKSNVLWQCHINVIPAYRKEHADNFAKSSLRWAWDNTGAHKIMAEIPSKYMNVVAFSVRYGFVIDGRITAAHLKDGKFFDIYYLSLERDYGIR